MQTGIIYTETVVHAAPEQFVDDAPYQLAIITLDAGSDDSGSRVHRMTARIEGERVTIGDAVEFVGEREGVRFYRLSAPGGEGSAIE